MSEGKAFEHLLILGAAGRAGKPLVQQALASGYRVTAVVRRPDALSELRDPKLELVPGDVTDIQLMERVLASGVDAVLSTLGIFQREPGTPLADMTAPLLKLMDGLGVKRLVCMSSLGVGNSSKLGNLLVRFITGIRLRYVLVDKAAQEAMIGQSKLDWTILRPPRLMQSEKRADYLRWQSPPLPGRARWQISTADAAAEMLRLLEDKSAAGQTWHISY